MSIDLTPAFAYCNENGVEIPLTLHARARNVGAIKAGDLAGINQHYHDEITESLTTYFEGGSVTGPRNRFRVATTESFYDAFYLGWEAGGGELPVDEDALSWLMARINQEYGFIDMLFQEVKELRKDKDFDFFSWVVARADGYVSALASIYNAAALLAKKNQILYWRVGQTETHCDTCLTLNGTGHRASWYVARNYIPRQPGAGMDCKGYHCDCELQTKNGEAVTL